MPYPGGGRLTHFGRDEPQMRMLPSNGQTQQVIHCVILFMLHFFLKKSKTVGPENRLVVARGQQHQPQNLSDLGAVCSEGPMLSLMPCCSCLDTCNHFIFELGLHK